MGDQLPALKGQFLTGRDAALPQASSGHVALVVLGRGFHHGGFDTSRSDELKALLASLARPVDR